MGEVREPSLGAVHKGNRALDVPHRPQREREVEHGRHAGILSEAKGEIVVTPGLKQRDSAFQMAARFAVLSGEPMRHSSCAVSDASLSRIRSCLDVAEEGRGVPSHRWQFAPHMTACPQTVVDRQPFQCVFVAKRRLPRSCEGRGRLRRAVTPRCDQRVAVGDVQSLPLT
jgi:hypothetical protein